MGRFAVAPQQRAQRYRQKAGNIAYSSGVTTPLQIPQTDYLVGFDVMSNQQVVTGATPPVYAGYGAFGALANVAVKVNGGRAPFSMPGYHADVFSRIFNPDYSSPLTANPNTASTTNNIKNHLRVPLVTDYISNKGTWYTGDVTLNLTVNLTMAAAATVFSTVNGATIQGSWDIWTDKFNLPAPDQDGGWLDEITYYQETILQGTYQLTNGTTNIVLPIDVDYERILLIFYTGSNQDSTFAPADGLYTTVDLLANEKFHLFDTLDEQTVRFEQAHDYKVLPPAGTGVLSMFRWLNSRRDVLPTDYDYARRLVLKIASTSSSNKVDVITQTVTDSQFAEKWVSSYKASHSKAA
jgi:hypothetical protein